MDPKFAALVEKLAPKLQALLDMKPLRHGAIPKTLPESGVYLFSLDGKPLYVGRSNVLRKRFYRHFRNPRGAAFAFLLARKQTGRTQRSHKKGIHRHIDNAMVKVISRAFRWRDLLENGTHATIAEIAAAEKINESYVGRVLRLTLLAPDIVEAILGGTAADGAAVGLPATALSGGLAGATDGTLRRRLALNPVVY
jgi:hypothetical protein